MLSEPPNPFRCHVCGDHLAASNRRAFVVDSRTICEDCLAVRQATQGPALHEQGRRGRSQGMLSHGQPPMPRVHGFGSLNHSAPWTARDTAKALCLALLGTVLLVAVGWAAQMLLGHSKVLAAALWLGITATMYIVCLLKGRWNRSSLPAQAIVVAVAVSLPVVLLLVSTGMFLLAHWAWVSFLLM